MRFPRPPDGSVELRSADVNLRNIRLVLARPEFRLRSALSGGAPRFGAATLLILFTANALGAEATSAIGDCERRFWGGFLRTIVPRPSCTRTTACCIDAPRTTRSN
jgi:hypothetical protein